MALFQKRLSRMKVQSANTPATALLGLYNGVVTAVQLGSGVTLNPSTNPPTLTVSLSSPLTPQIETFNYTAAAVSQTLKFTPAANVFMMVTRNGLVLTPGLDYTPPANGSNVLSFTVNGSTSVNAPQSGDMFTFYYSH